jgi:hypothetical protein
MSLNIHSSPELVVVLGGVLLTTYGFVLFYLTNALVAMAFFTPLYATFTVLGVLVARDARRWGRNPLAWGLGCLFFGPFFVIPYVWAKWGATQAAPTKPIG